MTIQLAYKQLQAQLYAVYEDREAASIADMVIEIVTGQRKIDRILYKDIPVSTEQNDRLARMGDQLVRHRPVQYVLGEAWFMDMRLQTNESALIPRPETEELVQWMLEDIKRSPDNELSLLDIGTGSGCIPIAVRKKMPHVAVSAVDVSHEALQLAILNSIEQRALVDFLQLDFLDEGTWNQLGRYNIIVSNPPYIRKSEASEMRQNVLLYEPHVALFVPDEDPLIFYRAIAKFAKLHLKDQGTVYVEINESAGKEIVRLFEQEGFSPVILRKDLQGKDRMVKAYGGNFKKR